MDLNEIIGQSLVRGYVDAGAVRGDGVARGGVPGDGVSQLGARLMRIGVFGTCCSSTSNPKCSKFGGSSKRGGEEDWSGRRISAAWFGDSSLKITECGCRSSEGTACRLEMVSSITREEGCWGPSGGVVLTLFLFPLDSEVEEVGTSASSLLRLLLEWVVNPLIRSCCT